jgi:hypothetical protein
VLPQQHFVFVNSAVEVGFALQDFPCKGPSYRAFRFDQKVPDLLSSDGDAWKERR